MSALALFLLLASPESERMLLGPSPFFRYEGMVRALREGDRDLLERAARSKRWDARRLAAIGLGGETPAGLLRDPVAVVREAAVRSLGLLAPEPDLIRLLEDPDDAVRAEAAWALRGSRRKSLIRALFQDPSPTVRLAAFAGAGDFGRLRKLATKGDLALSVGAYRALGEAGGVAEASFLVSRFSRALKRAAKERIPLDLRDRPGAELALARAVGDCARRGIAPGGKSVTALLLRMLEKTDLEGNDSILLAEAIAGTRNTAAAGRILDAYLKRRSRSTLPDAYFQPALRGILHAFARERMPGLGPILHPLLGHADPAVRAAAVKVLSGSALLPALEDRVAAVRVAACARIEEPAVVAALLEDPSPRVRAAALRALGRIGSAGGVVGAGLRDRIDDPEAEVRLAAVGALLRLPLEDRTDLLLRAGLRDAGPEVRAAAAACLAFLQADGLPARAIAALEHPDRAVRANAASMLKVLTPARLGFDPDKPAEGSRRWKDWLQQRRDRKRPPDAFEYHVEDLRRRGIDLVLVLDATGSMAPVIQETKRNIAEVMSAVRRVVPDLRARIVAFRDRGDAFVTLSSPLTHDARLLEDFLACIPASGGADYAEAVLDGLREAVEKTPWRNKARRMVLLFGDAPPHDEDRALLEAILKEFPGVVHSIDVSAYATGRTRQLHHAAFREIAQWGRGTFFELKGPEDLVRSVLVLTLGPEYRAAIESLFGL